MKSMTTIFLRTVQNAMKIWELHMYTKQPMFIMTLSLSKISNMANDD